MGLLLGAHAVAPGGPEDATTLPEDVRQGLARARAWLDKQDDGSGWYQEQTEWVLRTLDKWRFTSPRPQQQYVNFNTPLRAEAVCGHDVTHVSAGAQFTVLMTRAFDVFGFGCNTSGQLGQAASAAVWRIR